MVTKIFIDNDALSDFLAEQMIELILSKPNALICFASGNSPRNTAACFVQKVKERKVDLSAFHFIGLGGIDMMVVGIGMNGHIGFNEPGSNFDAKSHVVPLDEITSSVGQKYFSQPMKLEYGITLGFHHLLSTKKVYLIANGAAKAEVIQKAVEGEVTTAFPASVMQLHKSGCILVDEAAASLLTR